MDKSRNEFFLRQHESRERQKKYREHLKTVLDISLEKSISDTLSEYHYHSMAYMSDEEYENAKTEKSEAARAEYNKIWERIELFRNSDEDMAVAHKDIWEKIGDRRLPLCSKLVLWDTYKEYKELTTRLLMATYGKITRLQAEDSGFLKVYKIPWTLHSEDNRYHYHKSLQISLNK